MTDVQHELPTRRCYHAQIPTCNICQTLPAAVDAPTSTGQWAHMCSGCAQIHGGNLTIGTLLTLGEAPTLTEKEPAIYAAVAAGDFDLAMDLVGDGDITSYL